MEYWYIWYEIYEDGKLLANSRARYIRAYKHKSSAERRARQMWSEDLYNPLTDTTISWKWIVSKTNPWEDTFYFKTLTEAENFMNAMLQMGQRYGLATRADAKELANTKTSIGMIDYQFGWIEDCLKKAVLHKVKTGHLVELPRAVAIM